MARKLKDMDIEAIALVDKAANRKKFYIIKRNKPKETKTMDIAKILKAFFGADAVKEETITKAQELPEAKVQAIGEALEVFTKYDHDEFPEDLIEASRNLANEALSPVQIDKEAELSDEQIIEKAGAALSKATRAQLERIKAIVDKMLEAKEKKAAADHKDLPEDVVRKLAELDELKEANEKAELAKKEEKEKARDTEIEELKKQLTTITEKLKERGVKKGLTDDDLEDDDLKEGKDDKNKKKVGQWPSLSVSLGKD